MPINLETLFQKGGYTASGVSSSPRTMEDLEGKKIARERLALDKEQFALNKEVSILNIEEKKRELSDRDVIDEAVANNTNLNNETQEAEVDHKKVLSSLLASGKTSAVSKYKEQLTKDLEYDVKELAINKAKIELSSNLFMASMDRASAGDGEGALAAANEAANLTGSAPIVDIGIGTIAGREQAKIKTKDGKEQLIDVEKFRKSLVDANVVYSSQQAMELQRIKDAADGSGLKLSDDARKAMASAKLEAWKQGLHSGTPVETLAGKYGYIDEAEISYIGQQRKFPNVKDAVETSLQNQTLADSLKGPEKMDAYVRGAETMYRSMIAREIPKEALDPSVREKFDVPLTPKAKQVKEALKKNQAAFESFKTHTKRSDTSVDDVPNSFFNDFVLNKDKK